MEGVTPKAIKIPLQFGYLVGIGGGAGAVGERGVYQVDAP